MIAEKLYCASTIKRPRRTKLQQDQLDNQIIAELIDDNPQSVRHVYYRMVNPRLEQPVEKTHNGYRVIQTRCVILRRAGSIPYNWFADMSRRGFFVNTYAGASDFLTRMASYYRSNLWELSNYRCEVWCESRSIAGVIQQDCNDLAVDLFPCGGFSSLTFVHEAAQQHNRNIDGRPLIIYYIGDYDPAGVLIDVALERELRTHLRDDIQLTFIRLGINAEQIELYDLPTKPRKDTDIRSQQVESTVEAEAMPAKILRAILRERIESLLPEGAIELKLQKLLKKTNVALYHG
jgi:hypothetical protein